jgi:hypothetical protein
MYKLLITILLSFILVQQEPMMPWNPQDKIDWSDFKAEPQQNADVIAVTASGLSFGYSTTRFSNGTIDYNFDVTAHFYPEKSYYLRDHVTEITLDHERLHFDITELHARKFRQRVQNTKFTKRIDDEMEVINREINQQLRQMQKAYDDETSHSRILPKQMAWQKYVSQELEKFKQYSD